MAVFATAALSAWLASRPRRGRLFWRAVAAAMGVLLVEVTFSVRFVLYHHVTAMLRRSGIYDERRPAQVVMLIVLAVLLVLAAGGTVRAMRRRPGSEKLAAAGALFALAVFLVEMVSLHQVDRLLYMRFGPVMLIGLLWAAGAAAVMIGAVARRR